MTPTEIEAKARIVVAAHLQEPLAKVTRDADLTADLGADSLDYVELTLELELAFDIQISDDDCEGIKTFGNVVDYLVGRLATVDA